MTPAELSAIVDSWEGEKAALAKDMSTIYRIIIHDNQISIF